MSRSAPARTRIWRWPASAKLPRLPRFFLSGLISNICSVNEQNSELRCDGKAEIRRVAMLSAEQNDRITRTGPDKPTGKLLRRYVQPPALVDELNSERPIKAIRLLG